MKSNIRALAIALGMGFASMGFAATAAPATTTTTPAAMASAPAATTPAASSTAAVPAAKKSMPTEAAAGGGGGKVWVNEKSKTNHCEGTKSYGKTKTGEYMAEADAKAKGNHAAGGKACTK